MPALFNPNDHKHQLVTVNLKNRQKISFHVKEKKLFAFWSDVSFNSEMKDAAEEFAREIEEIKQQKPV